MLTFQSPRLEDKNWVRELFSYAQFQGCEYTFGNLYIWNPVYSSKILRFEDFFVSKSIGPKPSYVFPAGRGSARRNKGKSGGTGGDHAGCVYLSAVPRWV